MAIIPGDIGSDMSWVLGNPNKKRDIPELSAEEIEERQRIAAALRDALHPISAKLRRLTEEK
jgi:hypothetical protein